MGKGIGRVEILAQIKGIGKSYGRKQIITNCTLNIESNRIIGVVGENGIGKSTLLKILAGLCEPEKGTIEYGDITISYLFNRDDLYPWMKVKDVVDYYIEFYKDFEVERALELLFQSSITLDEKISKLSTGNVERLCMILALCRQVDLYLFDEPLGGIDPAFKMDIKRLLLSNIKEGATVVIATHLLKDMETLFDQLIIMNRNHIEMVDADMIREKNQSLQQYYLEVTQIVKRN